MLSELAGILVPVFTLAAIGYGWRLAGIPFEREFVTRLVLNVSGPCLIVDTLGRLEITVAEFFGMIAGSAALFVGVIVVVAGLLKLARLELRDYLPAAAIGNTGNLGLPLCVFPFGEEGLPLAVAVYVTNSVGQFILTPMLQSGHSPLRALYTTPVVYGALAGVGLMVGDVTLPAWLGSSVSLVGSLLVPLMLIALGNTIGELRVRRLGFSVGWGACRIVVGGIVGHAVAWAFGMQGVAKGVIILQGAMPAAVFSYLFAARYNRVPDDVAGIVLASTLLSALSLPFLVSYVLRF